MASMNMTEEENEARMARGELYYAFMSTRLVAQRERARIAQTALNAAPDAPRRKRVELYRNLIDDKTPLPPPGATDEEDFQVLFDEPYVESPIRVDYGTNIRLGKGVFVNYNSSWVDTSPITIGARTIMGPNCSFYSGGHPLDPFSRNGLKGPEFGKPITVGEDCWFGGNCTVLPGVTIGRGCTIGAGSIVTKDVPDFHCVAGNPARIIRKIEVNAPDPALATNAESA